MSQGFDFLLGCHAEVDRAGRFGWGFLSFSRFGFRKPHWRAESAAFIWRSRADRACRSTGEGL
jgi:hypothetical protein